MSDSSNKRRRRDRRLSNPSPMRLTERDLDVIEAVHKHRVLKQDQIQILFFGSRSRAQVRLEKLFDHEYLDRHFLPVLMGDGRSPTLYTLGQAGVNALRLYRGADSVKRSNSNTQLKADFLHHRLAINDVFVAVTQSCKQHEFGLEEWLTESDLKADYDRVAVNTPSGGRKRVPVVPDSYFTIVANERRYPFFLELDRGTMTLGRVQEKALAYLEYQRSGAYTRRYDRRSLRVLIVTIGQQRVTNLKTRIEEVRQPEMFWLTELETFKGADVLADSIWYQAGESDLKSLIKPYSS